MCRDRHTATQTRTTRARVPDGPTYLGATTDARFRKVALRQATIPGGAHAGTRHASTERSGPATAFVKSDAEGAPPAPPPVAGAYSVETRPFGAWCSAVHYATAPNPVYVSGPLPSQWPTLGSRQGRGLCGGAGPRGGGGGLRGAGLRGGVVPASAASTFGSARLSASVSGCGRSASNVPKLAASIAWADSKIRAPLADSESVWCRRSSGLG